MTVSRTSFTDTSSRSGDRDLHLVELRRADLRGDVEVEARHRAQVGHDLVEVLLLELQALDALRLEGRDDRGLALVVRRRRRRRRPSAACAARRSEPVVGELDRRGPAGGSASSMSARRRASTPRRTSAVVLVHPRVVLGVDSDMSIRRCRARVLRVLAQDGPRVLARRGVLARGGRRGRPPGSRRGCGRGAPRARRARSRSRCGSGLARRRRRGRRGPLRGGLGSRACRSGRAASRTSRRTPTGRVPGHDRERRLVLLHRRAVVLAGLERPAALDVGRRPARPPASRLIASSRRARS